MKLRTHYIFSWGLISLVFSLLSKYGLFNILSNVISSLFGVNPPNTLPDPSNYTFTLLLLLNNLVMTFLFNFIVMAFIISYLGNRIVDGFGHKRVQSNKGEMLVRTQRTHTVPRSIAWGLLSTLPFLAYLLVISYFFSTYLKSPSDFLHYFVLVNIVPAIIAGIIVGPSHMLLDVFTEKGIYTKKDGQWVRFALAHRKFNDSLANNIALALGILMLLFSIWELYSNYILYIYHYFVV